MQTQYGTKVTPLESSGDGWIKVRTEDGREREWHIGNMKFEPNDLENPIIAEAALAGAEAADAAKAAGLASLTQAAQMLNLSTECLRRWHKYQPARFDIVIAGCAQTLHNPPVIR